MTMDAISLATQMAKEQREKEAEARIKEEMGDNYKPPYQAIYATSRRQPRLMMIENATDSMAEGTSMQYIHIDPVKFMGDAVVSFTYKHESIVIQGRNLGRLITGLHAETIDKIVVFNADLYRNSCKEDEPFIESIERLKVK